jgi:tellurite resistance protein TerC
MFLNRNKEEKVDAQHHPITKIASKYFNVFPRFVGDNFIIKKQKHFYITPLLLVLLIIEFSDVIFATDSVPAIFSITKDPYIVFFSNIFAILGLRSLFFFIVHIIKLFRFLKIGISILLLFIGLKLIFNEWLNFIGFSTLYSLYFVLTVLLTSILLSLIIPKKDNAL